MEDCVVCLYCLLLFFVDEVSDVLRCVCLGTGAVDPDGGVDAAEAATDSASHLRMPACATQ